MTEEEFYEKTMKVAAIIYPDKNGFHAMVNFKKWWMADAIIKSYNYLFKKGNFNFLNTCLDRLEEKLKIKKDKEVIKKIFENEYQTQEDKKKKNFKRLKSICKSIAHDKYDVKVLEGLLVMDSY